MNPYLRFIITAGVSGIVGMGSTALFDNPLVGLVLAIATAIAVYRKLN